MRAGVCGSGWWEVAWWYWEMRSGRWVAGGEWRVGIVWREWLG